MDDAAKESEYVIADWNILFSESAFSESQFHLSDINHNDEKQ